MLVFTHTELTSVFKPSAAVIFMFIHPHIIVIIKCHINIFRKANIQNLLLTFFIEYSRKKKGKKTHTFAWWSLKSYKTDVPTVNKSGRMLLSFVVVVCF